MARSGRPGQGSALQSACRRCPRRRRRGQSCRAPRLRDARLMMEQQQTLVQCYSSRALTAEGLQSNDARVFSVSLCARQKLHVSAKAIAQDAPASVRGPLPGSHSSASAPGGSCAAAPAPAAAARPRCRCPGRKGQAAARSARLPRRESLSGFEAPWAWLHAVSAACQYLTKCTSPALGS
jgi:hypothetical protein